MHPGGTRYVILVMVFISLSFIACSKTAPSQSNLPPTTISITGNVINTSIEELRRYALRPRLNSTDDLFSCELPEMPTPSNVTKEVYIFYSCFPTKAVGGVREMEVVVPVRIIEVPAGKDSKRTALTALFAGPTKAEQAKGIWSFYGPHTQNIVFDVLTIDDLAVVNFDSSTSTITRNNLSIFVGNADVFQIVETLGQFPDIAAIAILIDGEPLCKVQELC